MISYKTYHLSVNLINKPIVGKIHNNSYKKSHNHLGCR